MSMVIKYGGNAMTDPATRAEVGRAIRRLAAAGQPPVIVHGGGPHIAAALDARGLEHRFVRGLRVTSDEAMEVVEEVLTVLGKRIAEEIGPAVGLTGRDAGLVSARLAGGDLGRVGHVAAVAPGVLGLLRAGGLVPVLASVAREERPVGAEGARSAGAALNVNADEVAGAVAGALGEGVCFLTNVPGILADPSEPASLIPQVTRAEARDLIAGGTVTGGMIPKVEAAIDALERGAVFATIADGRHAAGVERALAGEGTRVVS